MFKRLNTEEGPIDFKKSKWKLSKLKNMEKNNWKIQPNYSDIQNKQAD